MKLVLKVIKADLIPICLLLLYLILILAFVLDLVRLNRVLVHDNNAVDYYTLSCGKNRTFEGQRACLTQVFTDSIDAVEADAELFIQKENVFWTKWNTLNALAISLITAVSIYILNKTLGESAKATNAINIANNIQKEITFNSVRPWIVLEFEFTNDFRLSADNQRLTGEFFIRAILHNSGNSIATEVACMADFNFDGISFNDFEDAFVTDIPQSYAILRTVGRMVGANASKQVLFSKEISRPINDVNKLKADDNFIHHIQGVAACAYTSPLKEGAILVTYVKFLLSIDENAKSRTKEKHFNLSIADVHVCPIRYYQSIIVERG